MPGSRLGMAVLTLIALAFVVIGAWMIRDHATIRAPRHGPPVMILVIGIVVVAFFGVFAIVLLQRTIRGGSLCITDIGLVSNTPSGHGLYRWDEIAHIAVRTDAQGRSLELRYTDRTDPELEDSDIAAQIDLAYRLGRFSIPLFRGDVNSFVEHARSRHARALEASRSK